MEDQVPRGEPPALNFAVDALLFVRRIDHLAKNVILHVLTHLGCIVNNGYAQLVQPFAVANA